MYGFILKMLQNVYIYGGCFFFDVLEKKSSTLLYLFLNIHAHILIEPSF